MIMFIVITCMPDNVFFFRRKKKIECSWSQEEIELGSRQQNLMASGFQVSCQATLLLYVILRHDDVSSYFRSIQDVRAIYWLEEKNWGTYLNYLAKFGGTKTSF